MTGRHAPGPARRRARQARFSEPKAPPLVDARPPVEKVESVPGRGAAGRGVRPTGRRRRVAPDAGARSGRPPRRRAGPGRS